MRSLLQTFAFTLWLCDLFLNTILLFFMMIPRLITHYKTRFYEAAWKLNKTTALKANNIQHKSKTCPLRRVLLFWLTKL